jgi:hypothetical protein
VVVSHADEDHAGGLVDVLGAFPVSAVYDSGYPHTTQTYNDLLRAVRHSGARYVETRTGELIDLDSEVSMRFVYPDELGEGTNESSLALRLNYGTFAAQFTGDLGFEEEKDLLASGRLSPITLLEGGRHGSATSPSERFLATLSPEVGVVQAGEGNSYGHPTEEVLSRLSAAGVEVYRTDEQGEVAVTTDGEGYQVSTGTAGGAAEPVPLPEPAEGYAEPAPEPETLPAPPGTWIARTSPPRRRPRRSSREPRRPELLDGEGDRIACESLPSAPVDAYAAEAGDYAHGGPGLRRLRDPRRGLSRPGGGPRRPDLPGRGGRRGGLRVAHVGLVALTEITAVCGRLEGETLRLGPRSPRRRPRQRAAPTPAPRPSPPPRSP